MKIVIAYPPLESEKGVPLLSQNRQFQWFPSLLTTYSIYPVVPASAATLLKKAGHEIYWLDGIVEKWSYKKWEKELQKIKPDLVCFETKTPVVKRYWKIIDNLKDKRNKTRYVLVGDHVTALPEESMENSKVDYILTGGDYDFLLLNLVNHLIKGEKLEPGIWYRNETLDMKSEIKNTGKFQLNHDLNSLPTIDRKLTKWELYAYKNSNFYRAPGAYTMFGRDCWWGRCTFCSWTTLYPGAYWRVVKVEKALDEIGFLINKYKIREIMDDSGTFPVGLWLKEFCEGMIKRGYAKKIRINCNMRFNAGLSKKDYQLMGKAGFRFILYGLESASQATLDKINKNLKVEQISQVLKWAKEAGLMPHLTVMVGYPWEKEKEVIKTISLARDFFQQGLADSLQATVVIPYPGTPLFKYCDENNLLKTKDWERYDMREPIIKTGINEEKLLRAVRSLYSRSIWTPRFIFNTLKQLNSLDGVKYVGFQGLKYLAKLWEFRK